MTDAVKLCPKSIAGITIPDDMLDGAHEPGICDSCCDPFETRGDGDEGEICNPCAQGLAAQLIVLVQTARQIEAAPAAAPDDGLTDLLTRLRAMEQGLLAQAQSANGGEQYMAEVAHRAADALTAAHAREQAQQAEIRLRTFTTTGRKHRRY